MKFKVGDKVRQTIDFRPSESDTEHMDLSKFKISRVNSKYSLAKEISAYYNTDLTNIMLGFIKRKGEIAVRDEFIQAQKVGTPIGLFIWRLKQIKIIDVSNNTPEV